MKRFLTLAISLTGIIITGYGLFSPLAWMPVVYEVRFTELNYGGEMLAWVIISLMFLSIPLSVSSWGSFRYLGGVLAGAAVGICSTALLDIYRWAIDQLQQLGGIELWDKLQLRHGCTAIGGGLLLWSIGLTLTKLSSVKGCEKS